ARTIRPEGIAEHSADHARARLDHVPAGHVLSGLLSGLTVPRRRARSVFLAACAQHRDDARRWRRQHRQGTRGAPRQDRPGGREVVMVHWEAGAYGLDLVRMRADKMRGFIDVEGNCGPLSPDDIAKSFAKVPMLAVFGDNTVGATGPNGDERRNACIATTDAIRKAGGRAQVLLLAGGGSQGKSHMKMRDRDKPPTPRP